MKKQLRFYFWMFQGYLSKHYGRIIVGIVLITVFIVGLSFWIPALSEADDTVFIEGIVGKYTRTQLPPQVLEYITHGLISTDESGNPIPNAAEAVDNSSDGKVFTIRLKKGTKWHNGTELTTRDLAYNLTDVGVEKPDDYTLSFNLKDSFAPFSTLLTGPLLKITPDNQILGIGDYYIKRAEYAQSQYLTSLELESTKKKPHTIKIKFFASEEDALTALKLGQIHGLQLTTMSVIPDWNNLIVYKKPITRRFVGVYFKMDDAILGGKDAILRQALSMAITDVPGEIPFSGPFPINSWASSPNENKNRNNTEKAKELLSKFKSSQSNKDEKIKLTISSLAPYRKSADHIAQNWRDIGVDVAIEEADKIPEKFQALLLAQELPLDPDQYSLWHSTQKRSNITGYANPRVDKDLEDARKTVDRSIRKEKYEDFQKQLFADVPVVYLYQPTSNYVLLKKYNFESNQRLKKFKE